MRLRRLAGMAAALLLVAAGHAVADPYDDCEDAIPDRDGCWQWFKVPGGGWLGVYCKDWTGYACLEYGEEPQP